MSRWAKSVLDAEGMAKNYAVLEASTPLFEARVVKWVGLGPLGVGAIGAWARGGGASLGAVLAADALNHAARVAAASMDSDAYAAALAACDYASRELPQKALGDCRSLSYAELAERDSANGYAWTLAAIEARGRSDKAGERAALERAAGATRFKSPSAMVEDYVARELGAGLSPSSADAAEARLGAKMLSAYVLSPLELHPFAPLEICEAGALSAGAAAGCARVAELAEANSSTVNEGRMAAAMGLSSGWDMERASRAMAATVIAEGRVYVGRTLELSERAVLAACPSPRNALAGWERFDLKKENRAAAKRLGEPGRSVASEMSALPQGYVKFHENNMSELARRASDGWAKRTAQN